MTKWARIENQKVVETTNLDPSGRYHPSLVWVECSDEVSGGFSFDGASFVAPPAPALTTAQDLAPGRTLEGLSAEEIAAFEELAEIINTNQDALRQAVEA